MLRRAVASRKPCCVLKRGGHYHTKDWLACFAEGRLQQTSGVTLAKLCDCNNSFGDPMCDFGLSDIA
jgi:hypothetical protein